MKNVLHMNFFVDRKNKKIKVERKFDAPIDMVWSAWTESELLDLWWAPKPYRAVTKSMNFSEGGRWHYYMLSPEGEKLWCLFDFEVINPLKSFSGIDAFCDDNAVMNNTKPRVTWNNDFTANKDETVVNIQLQFKTLDDLETIIQMGFREGFIMALSNLDKLIISQSQKK